MSTPEKGKEIVSKLEPKMRELQRSQVSEEDADRIEFLRRLDNAVAVEVTDWEAGFIESFLRNSRPMTPAQRKVADDMRERYEWQM